MQKVRLHACETWLDIDWRTHVANLKGVASKKSHRNSAQVSMNDTKTDV